MRYEMCLMFGKNISLLVYTYAVIKTSKMPGFPIVLLTQFSCSKFPLEQNFPPCKTLHQRYDDDLIDTNSYISSVSEIDETIIR